MRVTQMNPFLSQPKYNKVTYEPTPLAQNSSHEKPHNPKSFIDFKNFKKDDWILLFIIGTLILEGSTDYILLISLGYLFLIGL